MTEGEFIKILDWPGYGVYRYEINEQTRTLKLWVRRKRGNKQLICSGCGGKALNIEEVREREVRDLPWRKYQTTVMVEFYRVRCPKCGLKVEAVPQFAEQGPLQQRLRGCGGTGLRVGRWRGSSDWRPPLCGRSICATWNVGPRAAGSRRWASSLRV